MIFRPKDATYGLLERPTCPGIPSAEIDILDVSPASPEVQHAKALMESGKLEEGIQAAYHVLTSSEQSCPSTIEALNLLVAAYCRKGQLKLAHEIAFEQLGMSRGDCNLEARVMLILARVNADKRGSKNREQALNWALQARSIARDLRDSSLEAEALLVQAKVILKQRGDRRKAVKQIQELMATALPLLRSIGDLRGQAIAHHDLACAQALLALDGTSLENTLREAYAAQQLFHKANIPQLEAFELHCIAVWHMMDEDPKSAAEAAQKALNLHKETQPIASTQELAVLRTLVKAYLHSEAPQPAIVEAQEALERFEVNELPSFEAEALDLLSLALYHNAELKQACKITRQAVDAYSSVNSKREEGVMLRRLACFLAQSGAISDAKQAIEEALSIFLELQDLREQGATLRLRSECQLQEFDFEDAKCSVIEACEAYTKCEDSTGEAQALLQLSHLIVSESAPSKPAATALEAAFKAQEICCRTDDEEGQLASFRMISQIHCASGELLKASRAAQKALTISRVMGNRYEQLTSLVSVVLVEVQRLDQQQADSSEHAEARSKQKVVELAQESMRVAERLADGRSLALASLALAEASLLSGMTDEALSQALIAKQRFQESTRGDSTDEALAHLMLAKVQLQQRSYEEASESSEASMWLCQQTLHCRDRHLEERAWKLLEQIKDSASAAKAAQQLESEALQAQEEQRRSVLQRVVEVEPQRRPQVQALSPPTIPESLKRTSPSTELQLPKIEILKALEPKFIQGRLTEVTKGLIGFDEEIEMDMPLMESGLTSGMAIILRDMLSAMLPGISLPVTLVFDYPSLASMTDLIVQKAQKAGLVNH